jgi:hypothetical protein
VQLSSLLIDTGELHLGWKEQQPTDVTGSYTLYKLRVTDKGSTTQLDDMIVSEEDCCAPNVLLCEY